jgi:hypothetical protein
MFKSPLSIAFPEVKKRKRVKAHRKIFFAFA